MRSLRDAMIACAALRFIDPEGALSFFAAYLLWAWHAFALGFRAWDEWL